MQPDCSGQLTSQILLIMKVTSLVVLKIKTLATWFRKQHPEDPAFSWTAVKALVVVIMWFSVVWALANCSIFALHPTLTGLESTVSRHPLLLLHQFIPNFISYNKVWGKLPRLLKPPLLPLPFVRGSQPEQPGHQKFSASSETMVENLHWHCVFGWVLVLS